jgi:hypothetical protein
MHISLDRNGRAVVAGEGTYRTPMGAEQTDVMMNSPAVVAEMLREREASQTMAANRALDNQAAYEQALEEERAYEESLALDHENYQREALSSIYGGENPLAYIAALQTMAGAHEEFNMPLSGYALSSDGRPEHHRQISGHSPLRGRFGDFWSDMTDQLKSAAQSATEIAQELAPAVESVSDVVSATQDLISPQAEAAPAAPAAAPAPVRVVTAAASAAKSGISKFMSMKIGPVPVPLLAALGVAGVAVLVLRKKR